MAAAFAEYLLTPNPDSSQLRVVLVDVDVPPARAPLVLAVIAFNEDMPGLKILLIHGVHPLDPPEGRVRLWVLFRISVSEDAFFQV